MLRRYNMAKMKEIFTMLRRYNMVKMMEIFTTFYLSIMALLIILC